LNEKRVGEKIRENISLEEFRSIPISQAKEMGAMALFGEKYGEDVRVVKYGTSIELCGGTHVPATGMIGSLRIVGESSIAAGVRRIEAVTAEAADDFFFNQQDLIRELRALLNNMPNLVQGIRKFVDENTEMKKQLEDYVKEKAVQVRKEIVARAVDRNGVKLMKIVTKGHPELMKDVAFQIKGQIKDSFALVAGLIDESKCTLMVMLSDDLVDEGYNAGKLVKEAAKHIQGGGGGQPHFATAGGKYSDGLSIAVDSVIEALGLK